jgi:TolB-like protein/Tfp pilus assembly protein PilF
MLGREVLMQAVWPESFVEDANLTVAVSQLRKALGRAGDTAEYIETLPRVGYRFVATVREVHEEPGPLLIEKRTLSKTVIEEEMVSDASDERPWTSRLTGGSINRSVVASVVVFALVCGLALGAILFSAEPSEPSNNTVLASVRSIAVLPPKSLGEHEDSASLSLGLTDALITRLASVQKLSVRPTSAIVRYSDANQDPVEAGRSLGVDAVIDGTLQRDANGIRVTLRLIDVATGTQRWSGHFDAKAGNILDLQDRVVKQVGDALFTNVSSADRVRLAKQLTTNPEAYVLYLKGNYLWSRRGNNALKAADYFRQAIGLDPNFAQAYAALAAVNSTARSPSPEAEALIGKALELDNSLASAHATLAFIRMFQHWDWVTAEAELDRAIELDPYSATAHHWKGVYLSLRRRLDEAKAEMKLALEQDPLSPVIIADMGQLHYFARQYDQAIDYCNQTLALDRNFMLAHEYLLDIYNAKRMEKETFEQFVVIYHPDDRSADLTLFTRSGMRGVFKQQLVSQLQDPTDHTFVIARNYLRIGDKEQGLNWLEKVFKNPKTHWHPYLNVDPIYDGVRDTPRFKALLQHMNL